MRPWDIAGPSRHPDPPGLADALRRLHTAVDRTPTADDAPKLSTLQMTRAAREAIRLSRSDPPPA